MHTVLHALHNTYMIKSKRLMGEPKDVFTVENGVEYDVFAKATS